MKSKEWQNKYEILSDLGEGGNAKVYKVVLKESEEVFALKELQVGKKEKKRHSPKCGRFKEEIQINISNNKLIEGIVPIIEYSYDDYWYTMPIANPIMQYIEEEKLDIKEIVNGVIDICETLEFLHEKGISHRDIKPANIYYYQGRFCLGDFGLVDFPENNHDFTESNRGLGAVFTIAPEMKRNPKKADGRKADVFSLAKTMWMFLTKDEKGYDGVYSFSDPSHSLRYHSRYKNIHTVEIEELFISATDNTPDLRPSIMEFKERLIKWIDIYEDNNKSQASDWKFLTRSLFGLLSPETVSWRNICSIVDVLNIVGRTPAYNHMLFHDQGGLDFSSAEVATENGCIKIYDTIGYCHLVKPKRLYFNGFEENYRWNYFLLELDDLEPIFLTNTEIDSEYLVEDTPAHYVSAQYAQYGVYDYESGKPLPKGSQCVYRYIKGKFLIVMKNGPYNRIRETYDGRHGDCTAEQFRNYVEKLIRTYNRFLSYVKKLEKFKSIPNDKLERIILNHKVFKNNPFKFDLEKKDNDEKIKNEIIQQQNSMEFIKKEYQNWDFSDIIIDYNSNNLNEIKFVFKFNNTDKTISFESIFGNKHDYVCKDGHVKKVDSHSSSDCFSLDNRETAIELNNKLEKRITDILNANGFKELDEYEHCFSIELVKCGKPHHLFSMQEIEDVMCQADDRYSNQLVIDEHGYPKVIHDAGIGFLYPVHFESWNSGSVSVGKYAKINTLLEYYKSALNGWLLYLKNGESQYVDDIYVELDEQELLKNINIYYN